MRKLTEKETLLVSRMAKELPDSVGAQIIGDLTRENVENINEDGSIIRFQIAGYARAANSDGRVIVDGVAKDQDGAHLNVILSVDDDDRLYELEIVRFDKGKLIGVDFETLKFY